PDLSDEDAVLEKAKRFVSRILNQCDHLRPKGEILAGSPDHSAYFEIQSAVHKLRLWIRKFEDARDEDVEQSRYYAQRAHQFRSLRRIGEHREKAGHSRILQELAAAQDIQLYLKDLEDRTSKPSRFWNDAQDDDVTVPASLLDLIYYASYVQTLAGSASKGLPQQALIHLRARNLQDVGWLTHLETRIFPKLFDETLGLNAAPLRKSDAASQDHTLLIKGLAALPLARLEEGTQLF